MCTNRTVRSGGCTPVGVRPYDSPVAERRRRATATSAFGVSKREGHDASVLAAGSAPPETRRESAAKGRRVSGEIIVGASRDRPDAAGGWVALVVTSPPYFAGKEYEAALG